MNTIPTAEEKLKANFYNGSFIEIHSGDFEDIKNIMIEFAKLHVKAALQAASEIHLSGEIDEWVFDKMGEEILSEEAEEFNRNSIRNAYPLSNIK